MTRAEARRQIAERFRLADLDEPKREASLLVAAACGSRLVDLIAEPDAPLSPAAAAKLEAFTERREGGEPLSRILGRREFWSLEFAISPDVLDPRPDTETIVEAALRALRERRREQLRVLDLGVGSGALLCALLSEFSSASAVGVDRSDAAAQVARANIAALGLAARAAVHVGDWADGLDGPFDLIVSNPPYIRSADIAELAPEVRQHDPRLALDGGADGLAAYRALAPQIARLLAPEGWFFLEVGAGQAEEVKTIAAKAGLGETETFRDLANVERVVGGRAPRR
jgi:release factor glutamine methyltransferase